NLSFICLPASQDSLAVTVEVQEGEPSVDLPCQISKRLEEIVTVKWSRFDLNPNTVHQRDVADDLQGQNQVFRGRTSMILEALDSGDFSLTLRKPQLLDSGIYICSMTEDQEETALSGVQLHVKAVTVEVQEGEPSVDLPCRISKTLEDIVTVKWSRFDLNPNTVHQRDEADDLQGQNQVFRGRTSMKPEALDSGDFSLTLRKPQLLDSGIYICSMTENQEETALSGVQLHVKDVVYRVEVDSGEESVLLPFKTAACLPGGVRVRWRHNNRKVVYVNDGDLDWYQHWLYKDRTEIKEKSTFGDFSLTLKKPTSRDTGTYSCTVYKDSSDEILTMKQVLLKIKTQCREHTSLLIFKLSLFELSNI
uniref:Ig-like domain-containing protein n=1 Tax=Poecilia formosa TaxID=48698 RepID=A0A087X4Q2_POEFO